MRQGVVACLVLSLLSINPGQATEKRQVVAIFPINVKRLKMKRAQRELLTDIISNELGVGGLYQIMPPGDVKKELLTQSKATYKKCYEEKCQIELGRQLPANKLFTSTIIKIGNQCRVTGSLYDLRRQTSDTTAKAVGGCRETELVKSIEQLAAKVRAWGSGGGTVPFKSETLGEQPTDWKIDSVQEVVIKFESTPKGAVVLVDGDILCRATPCSKSVKTGTRNVSMKAERHKERKESVSISKGTKLAWQLTPNFGWLSVVSNPSGLSVTINDRATGNTPIKKVEKEVGVYNVMVKSPCHYDSGKKVKVEGGKEEKVSIDLKEKQGAIKVTAKDFRGNDVEADVFVDGKKVGRAPGTFRVSICARDLHVRSRKHGDAKQKLAIRERKLNSIKVKLQTLEKASRWVAERLAALKRKTKPYARHGSFIAFCEVKPGNAEKRREELRMVAELIKLEFDDKARATALFRQGEMYYQEAIHQLFENRPKQSREWMKKASEIFARLVKSSKNHPDIDKFLLMKGCVLDYREKSEEALAAFRDLIKQHPGSKYVPDAYIALGGHYYNDSKLKEALVALKNVPQNSESQAYLYSIYMQGWCYFKLKKLFKADEMFKKATELISAKELSKSSYHVRALVNDAKAMRWLIREGPEVEEGSK